MTSRQASILKYFSPRSNPKSPSLSVDLVNSGSASTVALSTDSLSQTSGDCVQNTSGRKRAIFSRLIPTASPSDNRSFLSEDGGLPSDSEELSCSLANKENRCNTPNLNDSIQSVESLDKSLRCNERTVTDFEHFSYEFLQPEKLRDGNMRLPNDPKYDPSTLYVPPEFLNAQSPAMKIWWRMKAEHFDTLLFFKMGRFYELYHMDAIIATQELDIAYMRGSIAHCGFPEPVGSKFISRIVRKNYKAARIEQTETPDDMAARILKQPRGSKSDKVVLREICEIVTPGTLYSRVDEDVSTSESLHYMFCFSCTEAILLDRSCDLLAQLQSLASQCFIEIVTTEWFNMGGHLTTSSIDSILLDGQLPAVLAEITSVTDEHFIEAKNPENEGIVETFGFLVRYLRYCKIDKAVLSKRLVTYYNQGYSRTSTAENMDLDGCSISSLDICNSMQSSLEKTLDHCVTKPGKRFLRKMLLNPSCNVNVIETRFQVINVLSSESFDLNTLRKKLRKVDGIQHGLRSIHALSSNSKTSQDPDTYAIMSDEESISKSRARLFSKTVNSLLAAIEVIEFGSTCLRELGDSPFAREVSSVCENKPSQILARFKKCIHCSNVSEHKSSPNRVGRLDDRQAECSILPMEEQREEYNDIVGEIKAVKTELESYLQKQRRALKIDDILFVTHGRNRYHMEIPNHLCKHVPDTYRMTQQKRSHNRYTTDEIERLLKRLSEKEHERDSFQRKCARDVFALFDNNYEVWYSIEQCIAKFDYYQSLATWKRMLPVCCEPKFNEGTWTDNTEVQANYIRITSGIHPFFLNDADFIPNDIVIVSGKPLLLTGPNMGGKSTILRQVGLIAVMAQVGVHIPAKAVQMSICDRILTRIGSYDKPQCGQSTFHVEVSEMKRILACGTAQSLVLVDEFGRGTSIEEGQAISKAVLNYIMKQLKCRLIFSTHFHGLLDDTVLCRRVNLSYMDFIMDPDTHNITFLYKLILGYCSESHGLVVARMANLPDEVISAAEFKSREMERQMKSLKIFRQLCKCASTNSVLEALRVNGCWDQFGS